MTEQPVDPFRAPREIAGTMYDSPEQFAGQLAAASPVWDPLAPIEPVTIPLKVSGGRATVTCRRWSGRQRLAYEDAVTTHMLAAKDGTDPDSDDDGDSTVKLGTMRLFATSLTVIGSTGFPEQDGRTFLTGTREQVEADLLAITDEATFEEIRDHATKVQPLPSMDDDDDKEKPAGGDAADPSLTPSTSQTDGAPVVESGSLVE